MSAQTELLDALAMPVYTTDAEGRITYYNEAAAVLWGHRPTLGSSRWCGSWRLYRPDGRPLPHDEYPMAVALREGRPVRGVEAIAERPDGTRVPFLPYPTPLKDAAGRVIGAINLLVDATDRRNAEMESAQLAAIVASSDDAIVSKTLDGHITSWNAGATRLFGYEAAEMIGQSINRIIPPELHEEERQVLAHLRRGQRIDHYETVRVAKDGRRLDISLTVSPLRNRAGQIIGASKVGRDITERKQAEKLQRLLIEELNHRVKNTLAIVQAIANQSLRRSRSPGDFVASFTGRIQALARAHMLLTQTGMQGAELTNLVREQVLLGGADDNRISWSGPLLLLEAQPALHMALVLHELATNAHKHGALSVPGGRLAVTWEMRTNGGRKLRLLWKESGGPTVTAPNTQGFGTSLIEQSLKGSGGEAVIRYAADGVSCEIGLPLPDEARPSIATRFVPPELARGTGMAQEEQAGLARKRILIIEDEPLVAMDLEATLAAAGCEIVGTAGSFASAKVMVEQSTCDAALVDVNLGGHPVDELAMTLTQRGIPFAFVTGYAREALPAGLRDAVLLSKPFSQEQLLAVVKILLNRHGGVVQLRPKSH